MIYLKKVTRKMNKYIKDKSERYIKKLEANVSKNDNSSNVSKNARSYWKATKKPCLSNKQMSFSVTNRS